MGISKAIQDSDVNTLLWGYLALLAEEERKKKSILRQLITVELAKRHPFPQQLWNKSSHKLLFAIPAFWHLKEPDLSEIRTLD